MPNKHFTFGSLQALRLSDGASDTEVIRILPADERAKWVAEALKNFEYETLSRDDKGLVRKYLQNVTGYSRAQVARHIAMSRVTIAKDFRAMKSGKNIHHTAVALTMGLLLLLLSQSQRSSADSLRILSGDRIAMVTGEDASLVRGRSIVARSVMSLADGTMVSAPLFMAQEDVIDAGGGTTMRRTVIASSPAAMKARVEDRREQRLRRIVARPDILVEKEIFPLYDSGEALHAAAPDLFATGSGSEGQILMIQNGKAVWRDFPYLEQIRSQAAHGNEMTTRAGGARSGGGGNGGGGGGSTTTTVVQTTTTTAAPSGWTDGTGVVYVTDLTDEVGIGTDTPETALEVIGTISGSNIFAGTFSGAGLEDCNSLMDKLVWDSATNTFACATDETVGTGLSFGSGDERYVNQAGDTMTGALTIRVTGGNLNTLGLNVINTISGAVIRASKTLATSGALVFEGAASGSSLYLGGSLQGVGLADCDTAGTSKLLWDATTGRFSCGTDTDTNTTYTAGQGLSLNGTAFSLSTSVSGALLEFTTVSGSTVFANNALRSSGSLVFEGAASGSSLYVATSIQGAGLADCDLATQTLTWDASTGRFSCGTDSDTIYTAGEGLTLSATSFSLSDTISGTLLEFTTVSGSTIFANTSLRSSGSLVWEGAASGASIYIGGSLQGVGLVDCDVAGTSKLLWDASTGRFSCGSDQNTGTTYTAGQGLSLNGTAFSLNTSITGALLEFTTVSGSTVFANNSLRSSGSLVWEGSASGASLWVSTFEGAGLSDCDLTTNVVRWDDTTNKFSCGTISTGGTSTGNVIAIGDDRYVRTAGDTMTGALTIDVTGGNLNTVGLNVINTISGAVIRATRTLASSGTLVWEGAASGSSLYVATSIQGSGLVDCDLATQTLAWDASTGRFSCGTDSDTTYTAGQNLTLAGNAFSLNTTITGALVRFNTVSGSTLFASNALRSSGSLVWEGAASGASLYIGGSLQGVGLTDCDADNQTLAWDASTGRFTCGDDDTGGASTPEVGTASFTGGVLTIGDARYVMTQGDTMTGALVINITGGNDNTVGLEVVNTISGSVVYAKNSLRSSGSLVWEGAASGASLYIGGSIQGVGLTDCDADNQTLAWDASTGRFTCGDDDTAGTGLDQTNADVRYVNTFGDTMTGALVVNITGGNNNTLGINVLNSISGAVIRASKTLASSGTLVWEGAASGSSLYIASSIQGAGLTDCDLATQTLAWDASTGRFSCGTDSDTTYTAGEGLTLTATSFSLSDTISGTLLEFTTVSGSTVFANNSLRSSGSLVWEGAASGASIYIGGSLQGVGLVDCDTAGTSKLLWDASTGRFSCGTDANTGTSYTAGQGLSLNGSAFSLNTTITGALVRFNTVSGSLIYARTTLASSGTLVWEGAASGSSLYVATSINGAGLTDCDLATQTLAWDASTGRFSCGTDSDTTYTAGQNLTLTGNAFSLNTTITGALVRFNTVSGSLIYARTTLASSGTLVWEGAASGSTLYVATSIQGAGLTDCDLATQTLAWDASTGRFSCGTDSDTTYTAGEGLTLTATSFSLSDTISGTLLEFTTVSGSTVFANNSLRSSGSLVWEGAASGASIYIGGSLQGVGLTDCDTAGTSKLLWDATTGRFSCGTDTDTNTTYTAGQGLSLNGTAFSLNTSITGALLEFTTVSGSTVFANTVLRSSGTLIVEGSSAFQSTMTITPPTDTTGIVISTTSVGINSKAIDFREGSTTTAYVEPYFGRFVGKEFNASAHGSGPAYELFDGHGGFGSYVSSSPTTHYNAYIGALDDLELRTTNGGAFIFGNGRNSGTPTNGLIYATAGLGTNIAGAALVIAGGMGTGNAAGGDIIFQTSNAGSSGTTQQSLTTKVTITETGLVGIGTASPGSRLSVSGSSIIGSNIGSSTTDAGVSLEVIGTISGSTIFANNSLRSSGSLVWEGAASGSSLYIASSIQGAGLADCDLATQTLAWDASTGRFSCGTDSDTTYTAGEGLTLTATSFSLSDTISGTLLEFTTVSGSTVFANTSLRSSGSLVWEGAASGATLYVASGISGSGLTDCDLTSSVLSWDSTTSRFSCASMPPEVGTSSFSGGVLRLSDSRYVNIAGDTMTGALVIQNGNTHTATTTPLLNVRGTMSGRSLYISGTGSSPVLFTGTGKILVGIGTNKPAAFTNPTATVGLTISGAIAGLNIHTSGSTQESSIHQNGAVPGMYFDVTGHTVSTNNFFSFRTATSNSSYTTVEKMRLTSSGSLGIGTTAPKAKLDVAGSMSGTVLTLSNLRNCNLETSATGAVICGIDDTATEGLSIATADARYVNTSGDTMTGALTIRVTNGVNSTVGLNVINTISGAVIRASKTLASSGTLVWEGAASGATLYLGGKLEGAGLTDCDLTTSVLRWDATTGRFSCGTVSAAPEVGTISFSGGVLRLSDPRYVNTAGDTMTGTLVINMNANVVSSGALVVVNNKEFGTGAYIYGSGGNVLTLDTYHSNGGTKHILFGYRGNFDTNLYRSNTSTLKTDGSLHVLNTVSGSTIFANVALRSSGSLVFEGAGSGNSLYIANNIRVGRSIASSGVLAIDGTAYLNSGAIVTGKVLPSADDVYDLGSTDRRWRDLYLGPASIHIGSTGDEGVITYNTTTNDLEFDVTGDSVPEFTVLSSGILEGSSMSGSVVRAAVTLTSSGTLVWEGAASGSTLYVATSIQGAGLTDCDLATQTLAWDASTGRFSCGTDSDTTYIAGQNLTLTGNAFSLNTTITGALVRFTTVSGSTVFAKNQLVSSGTLVTESGAYIDGTTLVVQSGNNRVGIGVASPSSSLEIETGGDNILFDTAGGASAYVYFQSSAYGIGKNTSGGIDISAGNGFSNPHMRVLASGNVGIGTNAPDSKLEVIGTISGSTVFANTSLRSSGSLVWEGTASGRTLNVMGNSYFLGRLGVGKESPQTNVHIGNQTAAVDLLLDGPNSNATSSALYFGGGGGSAPGYSGLSIVHDTASDRLDIRSESSGGSARLSVMRDSGNVGIGTTAPGSRLSISGALIVNPNGNISTTAADAGLALEIIGTASGRVLRAQDTLASSGSLVWEGAASGATLYIGGSLQGIGLTDCDLATQTLAWDASTGRFSCGTDSDTTYTAGEGLTLTATSFSLSDTISGTLLEFTTVSGSTVFANTSLRSSGSLVWEGAASGASIYIGGSLQGVGLVDCDTAGTSKLLWDASTGRFSCGTDANTGTSYTAGQGLSLNGSAFSLNTTITGALVRFNTVSGSLIYARTTLASSGTLVVEGASQMNNILTISRVQDSEMIRLEDTTNSDSVGIFTGSGSPEGVIAAQRGSMYSDSWNGKIYKKGSGDGTSAGWEELTGSGSRHMAKIYRSAAQSIPNGIYQKIYFDTEDFDKGDIANVVAGSTGSGRITIRKAGTYMISFSMMSDAVIDDGEFIEAAILRNNGIARDLRYTSASANQYLVADLNEIFNLNAGDTIEVKIFHNEGASMNTLTSSNFYPVLSVVQVDGIEGGGSGGSSLFTDAGGTTYLTATSDNLAIGAIDADTKLEVIGTVSGAVITTNTLRSSGSLVWEGTGSGNSLYIANNIRAGLSIASSGALVFEGAGSGNSLYIASSIRAGRSLASSGTFVWEGAASGATLYLGGKLEGAGLTDCDLATQTLAWDATTGRFSCGTDSDTTYTAGQGLTLTSTSFRVSDAISGTLLEFQTVSGALVYAKNTLASSGTLVFEGAGSGNSLYIASSIRAGRSLASSGALTWEGAASGATIYIGGSLQGVGLTDCDTAATSKLLWDASTGRFFCGTDQAGAGAPEVGTSSFSGGVLRLGDPRYVNVAGDTMTGALVINMNASFATGSGALSIINNKEFGTGAYIYGSGGNILTLDTYNATGNTKHILFGYRGHFDTNLYRSSVSTLKTDGSLYVLSTVSGSVIKADRLLSSSGTLVTESGAYLDGNTFVVQAGSNRVGIGTASPKTALEVLGTISGSSINTTTFEGAGLSDCDGTSKKLLWDATTKKFSCGNDQGEILISTQSASTSSQIDFTSGLDSTYDEYIIRVKNMVVGTDGVTLQMRISTNGGSSYLSGSSDYAWTSITATSNAADQNDRSTADTKIEITRSGAAAERITNTAGAALNAQIRLYDPASSSFRPRFSWSTDYQGASATSVRTVGTANYTSATSYNAIRLFLTSGTITSGTFELYGVQKNSGADVAEEYYFSAGDDIDRPYPGMVVKLDPDTPAHVRVTDATYESSVLGVISTDPGIRLSDRDDMHGGMPVDVALVGRVPVFVNGENGSIQPGDYLTSSSEPGVAMKATRVGQAVIGQALSGWNVTETGSNMVMMYIKNGVMPDGTQADSFITDPRNYIQWIGTASGATPLQYGQIQSMSGALHFTRLAIFDSGVVIDSATTNANTTLFQLTSDVGSQNNTVLRVNASGAVFSDATYNSSGADYAEWFFSRDALKKGEAVCIDPTRANAVARCINAADGNLMGIVSTNPAFIGNSIGGASGIIPPGYYLIGLIGQVPAKVTAEGGAIRPGDQLTSASIPGYARKAAAGESTVGVALEGLESGQGVINVLISRRNSSITVDAVEDKVLETIASMEIEDEVQIMIASAMDDFNVEESIEAEVEWQLQNFATTQQAILETVQAEIANLKAQIAAMNSSSGTTVVMNNTGSISSNIVASTLELDSTLVTGGDARVGGDLYIDGVMHASQLFVPNGLSIDGGMVVNGLVDTAELRVASGAVIDGMLTINGGMRLGSGAWLDFGSGSIYVGDLIVQKSLFVMGDVTIEGLASFIGDVQIKGELIVSSNQAGFAMIPKSGTSVTVHFGTGFKATPVVTASPDVPVLYGVHKSSSTGFTIRIPEAATEDIIFSWHALSTGEPVTVMALRNENGLIFPLDTKGIPVSSNQFWNACIRNITLLDDSGQPYSCARYHDNYTWTHPDLLITFLWNTSVSPALLNVPDGYEPTVTEDAGSVESAFTSDDEEPTEESSSSSSESSVSSSASGSVIPVDSGSGETVPVEAPSSVSSSSESPSSASSAPAEEPATEPEEEPVVEEPVVEPAEEPVGESQPEAPAGEAIVE